MSKYYKNILLNCGKEKIIDSAEIQELPAGYHFGPHMHPSAELFVCMEGRIIMNVRQSQVEIGKGEYIAVLPDHPHSCDVPAEKNCAILQLHFRRDAFRDLFSDTLQENQLFFLIDLNLGQKNYILGKCSDQLYSSIEYLYEEAVGKQTNYEKLIDLYFTQILLLLSRDIGKSGHGGIRGNRHLLSALEYMKAHCAEKITVGDVAEYCDVFYIGGTKTGALCGEAVVFPNGNAPRHFVTKIKQRGALLAKGRLTGVQFDALFTDDLYLRAARNAIETAKVLKKVFQEKGYEFYIDSPTNQIFVVLTDEQAERLKEHVVFSFWEKPDDAHTVVRFATSWATKMEDVKRMEKLL